MTRLSNRQFPMLKIFAQNGREFYLTIEQAQRYDQRPFRSMLIQEWISFKPGHGFHVTPKGMDAWEEFRGTKITRKDPSAPLTSYFELGNLSHRISGAA